LAEPGQYVLAARAAQANHEGGCHKADGYHQADNDADYDQFYSADYHVFAVLSAGLLPMLMGDDHDIAIGASLTNPNKLLA
jgi:hypothetical protein